MAAEKELELQRQKQKEQQEEMEAQEKSFKENIDQLKKKMERDNEMLLREHQKMLEHKLKVSLGGAWAVNNREHPGSSRKEGKNIYLMS